MNRHNIQFTQNTLAAFCRRWKIVELSLFGSILRQDFGPDIDIDVLVTFAPEVEWSIFDHVRLEEDLSSMLGRKVDVISRRAVERSANWLRRKTILETAEPVYVA